MRCIVCGEDLVNREHEGVQVDECPAGHGLWVGLSELSAIATSEDRARPETERVAERQAAGAGMANVVQAIEREGRRACPVCGDLMSKLEYASSGIVLDRCAGHGAWLDAGELERVEAFAEGFRAYMSRLR